MDYTLVIDVLQTLALVFLFWSYHRSSLHSERRIAPIESALGHMAKDSG